MVKTGLIAALSLALLGTATALPKQDCPAPPPTGPKVNVIFFSDDACKTTVPKTIYTRNVFAGQCTNNFPNQTYKSLIIDEIDDQFIGTNSALIVGNANSQVCNFTNSVKFSIATREEVGKCQFIGISQVGPGKPLLAGNEYQLGPLQG